MTTVVSSPSSLQAGGSQYWSSAYTWPGGQHVCTVGVTPGHAWTHVYLDTAAPQTRVAHHHHALPGLGLGGVAELAPGHHSRLVVEQV